jgi:arylsulfatase A-like enzyme
MCFHKSTPLDLAWDGRKGVGSAQRRKDGRVLHHGSIKLGSSVLEGAIATAAEHHAGLTAEVLAPALREAFATTLGLALEAAVPTPDERARAKLLGKRYGDPGVRSPAMRTAALAVAALALASCAREGPRPNVLLITVDTLRADRLSAAGYARATTPNLDRLAAEGLRFARAGTPRAKTTPAIASLMTGLYPHDHGARDLLVPLDPRVPRLAERLRDGGWSTGAIVGNYVLLDRFSGLARGFDRWIEDLPDRQGVPPDEVPQRRARSLTDGALAALGLAGTGPSFAPEGKPWFLWLHYMDPHGLYDPPPEHRVFRAEAEDPIPADPGPVAGELQRYFVADYNVPPDCAAADGRVDAARVRDLYDGEVRYVDAEIGRLLDALRAAGELEKTIVVVTADHGESLGEHRCWFEHGRDAYETTCRVPLIVRLPAGGAPGAPRPTPGVRGGDLSLADLAPTILDLLRLPPLARADGPGVRGVSRVDLLAGDPPAPRPVFAERVDRTERSGAVQAKAARLGDWKLIRRYAFDAEQRLVVLSEELYDLARDPGETRDLEADPPAAAPLARLQAELLRFAAGDVRFADLAQRLQEQRETLDPEVRRVIEALGY